MCLMLLAGLSFMACDQGEDLDTNQYVKGVKLNVFGPCPVARGGVLRFLGSGMNQVTSIVLPGSGEITDLEVVSDTEIRITVPQDAQPGLVVLRTPQGELTTKTELTYSEPIDLATVSPNPVKPGQVLTLSGEYLNLIQEVIFVDNVTVKADEFVSRSRKELKVTVPAEAQTGKIIISDGAEIPNWIYSQAELKVVLPAVAESADLSEKKPGDEIVINGTDFDLIRQVMMPNGDVVEFTVATTDEGDQLTFTLPQNISDGAIVAIPASGVKVAIAHIGVAVPTDVVATPATGLRAGDVITLTGINLELVSAIYFPGVAEAVVPAEQSATEIKVAMPEAAISGNLLLKTESGAEVPVAIETLKPEFLAFAADAVSLGNDVTIQGKNLDLVAKVIFTGGAEVEVTPAGSTKLTFTMPTMNVETGVLTLQMANGEQVETAALTIESPEFCYIPVLPGEDAELKGGEVFSIEVANGDKLTGVQVDGQDVQFIISGNLLYISVPQMANANSKVKLISSNGEIEYAIAFIPASKIKNVVWTGMVDITWGDGGRVMIPASAFEGVPAEARMVLRYSQKQDVWAQAQFNYGDWSGIDFNQAGEGVLTFNQVLIPTDHYGWFSDGTLNRETAVILTQEILDNIQAKKGECEGQTNVGIIIQGSDLIFSQISLEWEVSLEQNLKNCIVAQGDQSQIFPLPCQLAWDDSGRFRLLIDRDPAIKEMKLKAGKSVMYFYVNGGGQMQINDGNWSAFTMLEDWSTTGDTRLELPLTQEMIDWLTGVASDGWSSTGFIIQGSGYTLNKVTILP